jgi:alkaline phosphatase
MGFVKRITILAALLVVLFIPAPALTGSDRQVILMISDGQGFPTVDAAAFFSGRRPVFESFPVRLAMQTFSASNDFQVNPRGYDPAKAGRDNAYIMANATDSAAAASAMFSGVKVRDGCLNLGDGGKRLETIFEALARGGMAVGVVSSVPWWHATPGAVAAHCGSRKDYAAIGREMIDCGWLTVIMGTGHLDFDDDGERTWRLSIPRESRRLWEDIQGGKTPYQRIETKEDFEALARDTLPLTRNGRIFGIPRVFLTLQQARTRGNPQEVDLGTFNPQVPSVAVMAVGALNVLARNPRGFAAMIESGGAVDWAAHDNQKGRLVEEQLAHHEAVQAVYDWVRAGDPDFRKTLLIVASDHDTGNLRVKDRGPGVLPEIAFGNKDHTNGLVPLYAIGAGSELFREQVVGRDPVRGDYIDNTSIYRVIRKAVR